MASRGWDETYARAGGRRLRTQSARERNRENVECVGRSRSKSFAQFPVSRNKKPLRSRTKSPILKKGVSFGRGPKTYCPAQTKMVPSLSSSVPDSLHHSDLEYFTRENEMSLPSALKNKWGGALGKERRRAKLCPQHLNPAKVPPRRRDSDGHIRDITEDLISLKVSGCPNPYDDEESFYEQRYERIPLHHRATLDVDKLEITSPLSPAQQRDPLCLPDIDVAYYEEDEQRCERHNSKDIEEGCWINHPWFGLAPASDLDRYNHKSYTAYLERQESMRERAEKRAFSRERRGGRRLPSTW